jgi:hypothetical protein
MSFVSAFGQGIFGLHIFAFDTGAFMDCIGRGIDEHRGYPWAD